MTIPYGRQDISEEDVKSVVSVLESNFLTQGPMIEKFEQAMASQVGSPYAVAFNSATSALHAACGALGIGPGDIVWTSAITFPASANCALYCGASVSFVDIDIDTLNMCPAALSRKLAEAEHNGTLPSVVIPVHMCGASPDMQGIHELSLRYGFRVIEDASHAVGAQYMGEPVGSCKYSDIVVFSFHPVKIMTTGEGGLAVCRDERVARDLSTFRSHGITRDQSQMESSSHGPWYYEQISLGYNYRMTDIQAALGLSQLSRLNEWVTRRNYLAGRYFEKMQELPLTMITCLPSVYSAYHLFVIRLDLPSISKTRRQVFEEMRECGILVNVHYIPVHTHPYYTDMGFCYGDYPQAERYYEEALTLPLFPALSEDEQDWVVARLRHIIKND